MRGNSVSIKGNLTRDAEEKSTASGQLKLEWGIAWNSSRKNQNTGQYEDIPHYFDCFAWVTPAQMNTVAPQLVKGAGCAIIDGSLDFSQWEANDGTSRSKVRIKVDDPISGMLITPPRNTSRVSQGAVQQARHQQPVQQPQQPVTPAYTQQQVPMYQQTMPSYMQTPQTTQQPVQQPAASIYDQDIPF